MAGSDSHSPSGDPGTPESSFLRGVFRLASRGNLDSDRFHRTRPPFTRLREVLTRIRAGRPPEHPARCQDPACQQPLAEHYYRRADGLALCPACFGRLPAAGLAREADREADKKEGL